MQSPLRETANLIPYKIVDGVVFVYLQKRDMNTKILPGHYSFFGGKIESGETADDAVVREIKEELNFDLSGHTFLGQYDSAVTGNFRMYMYFIKVDDHFEKNITVNEGEYGKFLSEEEVAQEPLLIESDKKILRDLFLILHGK